jgi:hypothetical protein
LASTAVLLGRGRFGGCQVPPERAHRWPPYDRSSRYCRPAGRRKHQKIRSFFSNETDGSNTATLKKKRFGCLLGLVAIAPFSFGLASKIAGAGQLLAVQT